MFCFSCEALVMHPQRLSLNMLLNLTSNKLMPQATLWVWCCLALFCLEESRSVLQWIHWCQHSVRDLKEIWGWECQGKMYSVSSSFSLSSRLTEVVFLWPRMLLWIFVLETMQNKNFEGQCNFLRKTRKRDRIPVVSKSSGAHEPPGHYCPGAGEKKTTTGFSLFSSSKSLTRSKSFILTILL